MNFDQIRDLAREVVDHYDILDTRPAWLKEVPASLEPREKYYLFLYVLLSRYPEFRNCVEIGTRCGTSALAMAAAGGTVVTIDVEPGCKPLVEGIATANGINSLIAVTADSAKAVVNGTFDILFIDGYHSFEASYTDYLRFRPQVRDGGLIIFDDTRLNPGMTRAWEGITDPKVELLELHYMGFGIAIKDSTAPQPVSLEVLAAR